MQNFSPNESVKPFLDSLAALQSATNGRVSFEYFLFGDSTRIRQSSSSSPPLLFNDSRSLFPTALSESGGRLSSDMVLISDGHWTRPRMSSEIYPHNTIHYLTLPASSPNPFVTVSSDAPETSPSDSSFTVSVTASGYAGENGGLTISLKEKGRTVKTERVDIESGYFTRALQFKTANSRPGRRLYTVEAGIDTAAPPAVSNFVHQTAPHFITYSMYSAKPTLDRRYIAQALKSNSFFREKSSSPDILFLFDWDSTAAKMTRELPRHAVAVFSGCLPCSTGSVYEPPLSIKEVDNGVMTNITLDLRAMPPPQEVVTCKQPPVSAVKRMLQATVNTTGGRANAAGTTGASGRVNSTKTTDSKPDNLMILFSGRFRGTQSLFCPVKGTWRWDFWPMSSDRAESELFSFSNALLTLAKELLLDNLADQLILYPLTAIAETDSARFQMSLPAAVPIFEPIKLSLQIQNGGVKIDTAINYHPTGLNKQPLSLPALPSGKYAISASLNAPGVKAAAFSDSFTVNKDMSELSVLSQNTQYLQEFAQPLDTRDKESVNAVFDSWDQRSAEKHTIAETLSIHRSWVLLGIVLAVLAIELLLRRRWGID
jgi:hypothetical protein